MTQPSASHTETSPAKNMGIAASGAPPRRKGFSGRNLLVMLIALVIVGALAYVAEQQRPRIDRFAVRPTIASASWWLEPIEVNPHLRKPAFHAKLNAVAFNQDGMRVWAVGAGGTILRTTNGGIDWERVSWNGSGQAAPEKRAAADWKLIGSAHAQQRPPTNPREEPPAIDSNEKRAEPPAPANKAVQEPASQAGPGAAQAAPIGIGTPAGVSPPPGTSTPSAANRAATNTNARTPPAASPAARPAQPSTKSEQATRQPEQTSAPIEPATVKPMFNAVFFTKEGTEGWVAGTQGTILVTRDGGMHWKQQQLEQKIELVALAGTDDGGWLVAVGRDGTIADSRDRGVNWRTTRIDRPLHATAVIDSDRAVVVGDNGVILATGNGGRRWTTSKVPTARATLNAVAIARDGKHGVAVGNIIESREIAPVAASLSRASRLILATEDGGDSWQIQHQDEDRAFGTTLWGVTLSADGQRGWAVGDRGIILATTNGGATWSLQVGATKESLRSVALDRDSDSGHAWAVGDVGFIVETKDGGATWQPRGTSRKEFLGAVAVSPNGKDAIAVGGGGVILATEDRGVSWRARTSGTSSDLYAVALASDGRTGLAAGEDGTILKTEDAGNEWSARKPGIKDTFLGIAVSSDGQRALASAMGMILRTQDGGTTWQTTRDGTFGFGIALAPGGLIGWASNDGVLLETRDGGATWNPVNNTRGLSPSLDAIAFDAQGRQGYGVVRYDSILPTAIWVTTDGGVNWQRRPTETGGLHALSLAAGARNAWAVGRDGAIVATEDGGGNWRPQKSSTKAKLFGVAASADGNWVLAVGQGGTVVATRDGGKHWIPAAYAKYPAPWFYVAAALCLAAVVAYLVWRRRTHKVEQSVQSIIDKGETDEPISSVDQDRLGFGPLAVGLSNYLRNGATKPPLTIAVSAPWGRGKSSIMRMLQTEMARVGVESVWFNAWHHQKEDVMLASLLESIRAQALPFWLTPYGLRFRFRLLVRRVRARPLLSFVALCILVMPVWHIVLGIQQWIARKPDLLREQPYGWTEYVANTVAELWSGFDYANPAQKAMLDKLADGKLVEFATGVLGSVVGSPGVLMDVVGWGLLAAAVFVLFGYGFRAFPGSPAVLLASLAERYKASDAEAQTGYRQRFKQNFYDVCEALQPRTMLIFIDDLDRCAPAKTAEMLEAVNYLVNSGPCFIVLGMARDVVEAQLAFQYKDLADVYKLLARNARANAGQQPDAAADKTDTVEAQRVAYVRSYLRKLINLEVRVPRLSSAQIIALLELEQKVESEKGVWRFRAEHWIPLAARWARPAFLWVLVLAIAASLMVQVTSGLERWNVGRLKQIDADRQLAGQQIAKMRELERQTLVAVDYARGREKRLATDLFHKSQIAVAGLEFRLPVESPKTTAGSATHLCPTDPATTPVLSGTEGGSKIAPGDPVNYRKELNCWQDQARVTRGVEARLAEVREAIETAAAARRRDAFGRINEEFDRATKASNAALASAGRVQAVAAKPEAVTTPPPAKRKEALDSSAHADEFSEVIEYHATPSYWPAGLVLGGLLLFGGSFLFRREPYVLTDDPNFRAALQIWHKLLEQDPDLSVPREVKRFQNRARYYAMRLRSSKREAGWFDRVLDRLDKTEEAPLPTLRTSIAEECVVALTAIHQVYPELLKGGLLFESSPPPASDPRAKWFARTEELIAEHDAVAETSTKHPFAAFPKTRASVVAFLALIEEDRVDEPTTPAPPENEKPRGPTLVAA